MRDAHRLPDRVRLEGLHPLKHALRFGARVDAIVTPDPVALDLLLATLAPDVRLPVAPTVVDTGTFRALAPRELPAPVLAAAVRPATDAGTVLARPGRIVVLDRPRHLGNLGAVVRVAAAAGAGGVLVVGDADPWHPTAVRAATGLGFALALGRADELPDCSPRPVVALDAPAPATADSTDPVPPAGPFPPAGPDPGALWPLPADAVVVVGTERGGLDPDLARRAHHRCTIPMRPGVSSLNLATAVAVALYTPAPPHVPPWR